MEGWGVLVEGAHGWVGRGHVAQIGPPLVPIYSPCGPWKEGRGSEKGGRRLGERKERGGGLAAGGWARRKKRGLGFLLLPLREFCFLFICSFTTILTSKFPLHIL